MSGNMTVLTQALRKVIKVIKVILIITTITEGKGAHNQVKLTTIMRWSADRKTQIIDEEVVFVWPGNCMPFIGNEE